MKVLSVAIALSCLTLSAAYAAEPAPYVNGVTGPLIPGYPPNAIFLDGTPHYTKAVSLRSAAALANLEASNPDRYAIVQGIIKAADKICAAGAPKVLKAAYKAEDLTCSSGIWLTSNPPKHELSFRIDDTVYTVLVSVQL